MRRARPLILLTLSVVAASGGVVWAVWRHHDPDVIIQGRRLSQWHRDSNMDSAARRRVFKAAGTNALPYVMRELATPLDSWTARIHPYAEKLWEETEGKINLTEIFENPHVRRDRAMELCLLLEDDVAPAAPLLAAAMDQAVVPFLYAKALGRMGVPGLLALSNSLTAASLPATRLAAAQELALLGAKAVPVLKKVPEIPNPEVRATVLAVLSEVSASPEVVVSLVAALLADPEPKVRRSAATVLGHDTYRPSAKHLRPAVVAMLNDPDPEVRAAATNTLKSLGIPPGQGQ